MIYTMRWTPTEYDGHLIKERRMIQPRFQTLQHNALAGAFANANQDAKALCMKHLDAGWSVALSANK